jgi:hypothetical protein
VITSPFERKTWGRIFIQDEAYYDAIEGIMATVDEYETKQYLPEGLVTTYSPGGKNELIYLHKFEMDKIALTRACLDKGIWIWCVDGFRDYAVL